MFERHRVIRRVIYHFDGPHLLYLSFALFVENPITFKVSSKKERSVA